MIRLRVKEVAESKKLSQSRLGRMADIDVKTMRRIYREPTRSITLTLLNRLSEALEVPASELIENIDE